MRHLLFFVLLLLPLRLLALTTAYVSFDHPEGWRCELSQGVWICQSTIETDRKESVILSIATMATEWDTLDNYEQYLKQSRTIQDEDGSTLTAKVSYARKRNINGVVWVDSLQHNSELPGFWARYLATVHTTGSTKLAILITYIVSEEKYSQLAPQFERMVASLKPNSEFDLNIASKQGDGPLPGSGKLGQPAFDKKGLLEDRLTLKPKKQEKKIVEAPPAQGTPMTTILILVGAAAVILLILRRRSRAKKAKLTTKGPSQPPTTRPPGPPGSPPVPAPPRGKEPSLMSNKKSS